jgi:hypothetical protein
VALAIWAGLGTFAILLLLDGLWAGRTLVRGLTRARTELTVAIESLVTGDADAAAPHFEAAREAADDALGAVGHPSLELAGLLPVIGDNIDAATAVAEASRATARAGGSMVTVARELGWTDIRIPASTAIGRLDLPAIEAAQRPMDAVVTQLRAAAANLGAIGDDGLVGPVAGGYRDAVEALDQRSELATTFRDTMRLATTLFSGEHRYLLVVPALGVTRPSGGIPTTIGVLTVVDGLMDLETMVAAPGPFGDLPGSPDWPSTARALMEAAESTGIDAPDGVIQLDAVALQDLMGAIGDVSVEERTLPLSDLTTTSALEIEAFQTNSPPRSASLHAAWVDAVLQAFLAERPGVETFALATASATRDRHLAVYVPGRQARPLLRSLGLDGRAGLRGPETFPVLATWSTIGSAHVGAFVDTTLRQSIRVREDGSATVSAVVLVENDAGTEPPSVLLGRPAAGLPTGTFSAEVTLYVPANARNLVAETSRPSPIEVGTDLGLTTVTGSIAVAAGGSTTLTVTYAVDDVVRVVGDERALTLRLLPQPTLAGVEHVVRVSIPEGSTILSASPQLRRGSDTATFSGTRSAPIDLEVRYSVTPS